MIFICVIYSTNRILLSPTGIPGVILCFCTGSHAAAGHRFLFTRYILNNFLYFFHFLHDCWPWPIDYLIRFWSIFLDVDLQFSRSNMEFAISQPKWSNCHETKSKHIDWTLRLKCDHQVWPWPWPWPWIFKVKYGIRYISVKNGTIATKRKANISIEL